MLEFFGDLFSTRGFPPRWYCGDWSAGHGWLHIVSDLAIFGAYAAIPTSLTVFMLRRKDVPFAPLFWLFAIFIFSCGVGHLVEASLFWQPWYRLSGLVKAVTAVASIATVIVLIRMLPQAMELPGMAQVNAALKHEVQERRVVEARLVAQTAELRALQRHTEAINEGLNDFTQIVSHDLQAPLRKLVAFAQLLEEDAEELSPAARSDIANIRVSAEQMRTLVSDLLQFARLGRGAVRAQPVDLEALGHEVAELLATDAAHQGAIEIGPLPTVTGDPTLLRQLVQNLLGNALKFTEAAHPKVRFEAEAVGEGWVFSVSDNGIGIPPQHAETVFAPLRRLHGRDRFPGHGIGLAVCKNVCEAHGGWIRVVPAPGGGARFEFTLTSDVPRPASPEAAS